MDILAAMLTYLTCVTGIVGALCLSAFLFFSTANQPAVPSQSVAKISAANLGAVKPAEAKMADAETVVAPLTTPALGASRTTRSARSSRTAGRVTAIAAARAIAEAKQSQLSAAQLRRLVQEERAKRWAYKDPDFESRFMSFAD
jgi:hypothetical protein